MPLVEYHCGKCSSQFEILVGVGNDREAAVCPDCGSSRVEKLLSSFSALASAQTVTCGTECPEIGSCGTSACPGAN